MINSKILDNITVQTLSDMDINEANNIPHVKKFFGDKYGSLVRIVIIDEKFSIEFCGGTHVDTTGDIGLFKIVKEESISSGVRRIFAKTGEGIINLIDDKINNIESIISELPEKYSNNFRLGLEEFRKGFHAADFRDVTMMKLMLEHQENTTKSLLELREKYIEDKKQAQKKLSKQNLEKLTSEIKAIIEKSPKVNGISLTALKIDTVKSSVSPDEFRELGEGMRGILKNGIALLAAVTEDKINLICAVSDNLVKEKGISAGKLISVYAKLLGGGGGGRPNLATAGGKDTAKLDEILALFTADLTKQLE
jgi:alanyl-tRNA synthetase